MPLHNKKHDIARGAPGRRLSSIPITAIMADALAQLAAGALRCFRVGYGRDWRGPFVHWGTIECLWKRGLADYAGVRGGGGQTLAHITREGHEALAAWRAANPAIPDAIVEAWL